MFHGIPAYKRIYWKNLDWRHARTVSYNKRRETARAQQRYSLRRAISKNNELGWIVVQK